MVRVSFWENGKDSNDPLPRYEDVAALNSALACEKIKEKYPNAKLRCASRDSGEASP